MTRRKRNPVLSIPLPQEPATLAKVLDRLGAIYANPLVEVEEEGKTLIVTATGTIEVDADIIELLPSPNEAILDAALAQVPYNEEPF